MPAPWSALAPLRAGTMPAFWSPPSPLRASAEPPVPPPVSSRRARLRVVLSRNRQRLLRRISTRKGREAEGLVLLEGPRVVATAIDHGAELSFVVVEEGWSSGSDSLSGRLDDSGAEVVQVPAGNFQELAATESPQGVLAVALEPRVALPPPSESGGQRWLVLDGVQDPGNVGTVVRAAAALGVDGVLVLDGTADPWGPKAVRASAGLVFLPEIHRVGWAEAAAWLGAAGLALLVADGRGEDLRVWLRREAPSEVGGWALLLGNEASGARPEAEEAAYARLAIPLAAGVDSLNVAVAGAILLWALGPGREAGAGP